jgi:tetratricopeptide (TPR) repeat protein
VRAAKAAEPDLPDDITPKDLHPSARNELKTLSKENAEAVARHLAMAARLIDEDAEKAHAHALAASRRAGRIAVVRETVAITAYALGDYALALRELRTYRRISGKEDQVALMVDSERGVGRPDRAVELGRSVDRAELPTVARVELAIAMSGARLDLGDPARALSELDIPELDPDRAFEWSPSLFQARATVLEELGRTEEAEEWHHRAVVAAEAIDDAIGAGTDEEILVIEEFDDEEADDVETVDEDEEASVADELVADDVDNASVQAEDTSVPDENPSVEGEDAPVQGENASASDEVDSEDRA